MPANLDKIIDQALMSPETVFIENLRSSNYPHPYWLMKNLLGKKFIMPMKIFKPIVGTLEKTGYNHLSLGSEQGDAFLDPRLLKRLSHLKKTKNPQPEISVYTNLLGLDHFSDEELGDLLDSITTIYIDFTPRGFLSKKLYPAGYFKNAIKNLNRLLEIRSGIKVPAKFHVIHRKDGYFNNKPEMKAIKALLDGDHPMVGKGVPCAWIKKNPGEVPPLSKMAIRKTREAIYPCWYIRNPRFTVKGSLQLCSLCGNGSKVVSGDFKTTAPAKVLTASERRQLLVDYLTGTVPRVCRDCPCYIPDHYFNFDLESFDDPVLASEPAPLTFTDYTFPRKSHFKSLEKYGPELYSKPVDSKKCAVKVYQNLLVLAFLKNNIPAGARILEVGGGNSLLLSKMHDVYECWNVDKFEGLGQGPKEVKEAPYKNIYAYMGEFATELPPGYFDLVFSISALEHVEPLNRKLHENIIADINRVLKPGGYSLHSLDVIVDAMMERSYYDYIYHYLSVADNVGHDWAEKFKPERNKWENREVYIPEIINAFFNVKGAVNAMPANEDLSFLIDVWTMPEPVFNKNWQPVVKRSYREVGRPSAINVLWRKRGENNA